MNANDQTAPRFDYTALSPDDSIFIRAVVDRIERLVEHSAEGVSEIGFSLLAVRSRLPRGDFDKWLGAEFKMSEAMAQRFICVAQRSEDDLPFTTLYDLAGPWALDGIEAMKEAEQRVCFTDVEHLLADRIKARIALERAKFVREAIETDRAISAAEYEMGIFHIQAKPLLNAWRDASREVREVFLKQVSDPSVVPDRLRDGEPVSEAEVAKPIQGENDAEIPF